MAGRPASAPPTHVVVETTVGTFTVELYYEHAPKTCWNFAELARRGYYNNTIFHRIIKDFMIQGGDPTGTGRGGESVYGGKFEDEISKELKHTGAGVLSMANAGPNTNGSKHTVFGRISDGMKVIQRMGLVPTGANDSLSWPPPPTSWTAVTATDTQHLTPFGRDVLLRLQVRNAERLDCWEAVVMAGNHDIDGDTAQKIEPPLDEENARLLEAKASGSMLCVSAPMCLTVRCGCIQIDEVIRLVDDTELIEELPENQNTDTDIYEEEGCILPTVALSSARKLAWIHVVESPPALSPDSSIFTFVPVSTPVEAAGANAASDPTASTECAVVNGGNLETGQDAIAAKDTAEARADVILHIDSIALNASTLEIVNALHAEKSYAVPADLPELGWHDCFRLGLTLSYTVMLLRWNISPRVLVLSEAEDVTVPETSGLGGGSGNHIGPLGIQVLCDALEDAPDSMLLHLNLSDNRISNAGMPHLCRALRESETLVWLNLSWNQLTSVALLAFLDAIRDNFVLRDVAMYGRDCDDDRYCQNHESKYAAQIVVALRSVNDSFAQLRLTSARAYLPIAKVKQSRWVALPGTNLMEIDALVLAGLLRLNTKLLTLDLSNNPGIERWAVLKLLASIQHCKTLKHVNLADTGLHEEVAESVAELIAANATLATITMHETALQVQELRGCQHDAAVVETMEYQIPAAHHFDRWILAKCLALNRPTQQLNGIRVPRAPVAGITTTGSKDSNLVSANWSGRAFDLYEVVFLSKKVFHHLHIGRVALNNCQIESYGGIALADAVRNHATLQTLELEHNAIGSAGGSAMVECIAANASLTCLNLSWNNIGNDGAAGFGRALQSNKSLLRLDVRGNRMSAAGILAISDGLRGNACLQELHLCWNVICPRGAEALADALLANKTLRLLDIEHHTMGSTGALAFARMLGTNTRLQELNMKGDDAISDGDAHGVGPETAERIAVALTETNTSLTNLNMAQNQIGKDGVVWFSNVLKFNRTLRVLDLSLSEMDSKIAIRFFECLAMNHTLVKLNLAHNRISNEGMMACIRALEINRVLQDLNLTDNFITEEPMALLLQKLLCGVGAASNAKTPTITLQWLCLADNSMTKSTFQGLRTLAFGPTIVLEEATHHHLDS
ncbi:Lrr-containing protein, partial [Globisporangium splendens]